MGTILKKRAITTIAMIAIRSKQRAPRGPLRRGRHRPPHPARATTKMRGFAVGLLQMQPAETIDSIHDCRVGTVSDDAVPETRPRLDEGSVGLYQNRRKLPIRFRCPVICCFPDPGLRNFNYLVLIAFCFSARCDDFKLMHYLNKREFLRVSAVPRAYQMSASHH